MYKFLHVHIQLLNFWVNIYHFFLDIFYNITISCIVARLFVIHLEYLGICFTSF